MHEFVCLVGFGLHRRSLPRVSTAGSARAQHSVAAIHVCRKAQAAMKILKQIITIYLKKKIINSRKLPLCSPGLKTWLEVLTLESLISEVGLRNWIAFTACQAQNQNSLENPSPIGSWVTPSSL